MRMVPGTSALYPWAIPGGISNTRGFLSDKYSNFTVLTNDNPRFENPAEIIKEIVDGFESENFFVILDRQEAIKNALSKCSEAVIVLAGKGPETRIQIGDHLIPYNDQNCLIEWCIQNNLNPVSTDHICKCTFP